MVSNFEGQSTFPLFKHQSNIMVTSNFALQHLLAACLFAKNCKEIERENEGKPLGSFFEDIRSYASGAILSSVAGLEAYINKLYLTHGSPLRQALPNFKEDFYKTKESKGFKIERYPTLKKYQHALSSLKNGRAR